jgi:hypothetical protein
MANSNRYDLEIKQGATYSIVATWAGSDGSPINLTSYTARLQIRESYTATSTLISLTNGSGITLGGSAGTIAITITAAQTAALSAPGSGVYDLEMVSAGGVVTRLLEGVVTISAEVTR